MHFLRQSTAATVVLGPFVDAADGATSETGLTIAQADIRLSKNGASFAQTHNSAGAAHLENGWYSVPLDTTDTNTLGRLTVAVSESGALPVWAGFMVLPANVYDSLFGSDFLQVDVRELGSSALDLTATMKASINAEADTSLSDYDPPTKAELDAALAALNDLSAAQVNAEVDTALSDYDPPTKAELDAALAALDVPTAAAVADAVWDEAASDHASAGTTGKALANAAAILGAGAVTFTYTLTSTVDGAPIVDADVWVTSDQAGHTVIASGTTNSSGQVTFYLDPGTVYVWRQKPGYNFTNPDPETVAAA